MLQCGGWDATYHLFTQTKKSIDFTAYSPVKRTWPWKIPTIWVDISPYQKNQVNLGEFPAASHVSFFLGVFHKLLVGGFNPFEKYSSNWIISPSRGENKKYLKPRPSKVRYDWTPKHHTIQTAVETTTQIRSGKFHRWVTFSPKTPPAPRFHVFWLRSRTQFL